MAKANDGWKVLPHGPLVQKGERLWLVEGTLERMPIKRVMAVARREDGQLVVHNAIALDETQMAALDALGPVGFIVVPNRYHRLDAPAFKARYPNAKIVAPAGAREKVEEVVPVDCDYAGYPSDGKVELRSLDGLRDVEGVMVVRGSDGTALVLTDALFNMPHVRGPMGFVLKHVTNSTGGPRISRLFSFVALRDKAAFRADLEALARTPNLRLVSVAHHEVIDVEPGAVLARVAAML